MDELNHRSHDHGQEPGLIDHFRLVAERTTHCSFHMGYLRNSVSACSNGSQISEARRRVEKGTALRETIVHDFNNLLAIIRNYSEFVFAELPEGTVRDDIKEVIKASDKATELIHQLIATV